MKKRYGNIKDFLKDHKSEKWFERKFSQPISEIDPGQWNIIMNAWMKDYPGRITGYARCSRGRNYFKVFK